MIRTALTALAFVLAAAPLGAQDKPAEPVTPGSVIAASQPAEWKAIDPNDLLVMDLAPDARGGKRQVVIELMPPPFSQGWVGNIRTLARAHWWDGTTVYRVVDNWVTQWGDGEDDAKKAKPLPPGIMKVPESEYPLLEGTPGYGPVRARLSAQRFGPTTGERQAADAKAQSTNPGLPPPIRLITKPNDLSNDPYAAAVGVDAGWPLAFGPYAVWPIHCYGSVGVARDLSPDTGTGAELYAVIGQAPRQLDRNIAVVGRVIEGIENLSALPRGKGAQGVYDDPSLKVPIVSVRLGSELPAAERPRFEYLASDSKSFADYVHVKANRNDAFYKVPAGGIDVCNVQPPIRRVGAK